MKLKKIVSLIVLASLAFAITSCKSNSKKSSDEDKKVVSILYPNWAPSTAKLNFFTIYSTRITS